MKDNSDIQKVQIIILFAAITKKIYTVKSRKLLERNFICVILQF